MVFRYQDVDQFSKLFLVRVSFQFEPSYSGGVGGLGPATAAATQLPPIFNTWLSWDPSSQGGQTQPVPTQPPTTTPAPTPSPYDLWYYR